MFADNMILITTEDHALFDALLAFKEGNMRVSQYYRKEFDPVPLLKAVVEFSSQVEVGLFTAWLYDYVVNQKPKKTLINNQEITNNITQINIIIKDNVNIQQQEPISDHTDDL